MIIEREEVGNRAFEESWHALVGTGCCVMLNLCHGMLTRGLQYPKKQVSVGLLGSGWVQVSHYF